jgi:hypothetical protein
MSLSFEDVFSLLETEIQAILKLANYQTQGFLVDRYIATVLFANSNLLKPEDYRCATNPRFQELYFNDVELAKVKVTGYANRLVRLRSLLGCENKIIFKPIPVIATLCNEDAIRRAIDRYPVRDDRWGPELFDIPITQLAQEFGQDAFNVEYLEFMYDNLGMTRRGGDITLRGLIGHALRGYKFAEAERESAKTPEQIRIESNNHWFEPSWLPSWSYMKCFLRVFQSDSRTRSEFENMVSDQELGIVTNNAVCDRDSIQRAIDQYGADLLHLSVDQLSREFGRNAFNTEYLNEMYDTLSITRMGRNIPINFSPIVFNALQMYNSLERQNVGEEMWEYMKCLLRVLQGDPRTRQEIMGMPTDAELGI